MKWYRVIICILLIQIVAGCGTKKHLHRDRVLSEPRWTTGLIVSATSQMPSSAYDGRLNLLYEKKIKGTADSPILIKDGLLAFKSSRRRFLAFDQFSGDNILQIKKRRGYVLNPVIQDSLLIMVKRTTYGEIQVLNLYTGKVIEERVVKEIRSGPIIVSDHLIFGTTRGLISISLPELETNWHNNTETMVDISPISGAEIIYSASGDGLVSAFSAEDGTEIWQTDCGSSIVSKLSLGQNLYVGLADNRISAIDKNGGAIKWDRQFDFQIHGGVMESDNRIYFGATDGSIYCLASTDGSVIWKYRTEGIVTATPVVYGDFLLVGSHDRHFYSLGRIDGILIDRRRLEGPVIQAAAIDNDRIFVTCRANRLYCFDGGIKKGQ